MSARNLEESHPGACPDAHEVVAEGQRRSRGTPQSDHADLLRSTASETAILREMICSLGGVRAAQELLHHNRDLQVSSPQATDTAALREVVRLLGKQYAAEHLEQGRKS